MYNTRSANQTFLTSLITLIFNLIFKGKRQFFVFTVCPFFLYNFRNCSIEEGLHVGHFTAIDNSTVAGYHLSGAMIQSTCDFVSRYFVRTEKILEPYRSIRKMFSQDKF